MLETLINMELSKLENKLFIFSFVTYNYNLFIISFKGKTKLKIVRWTVNKQPSAVNFVL